MWPKGGKLLNLIGTYSIGTICSLVYVWYKRPLIHQLVFGTFLVITLTLLGRKVHDHHNHINLSSNSNLNQICDKETRKIKGKSQSGQKNDLKSMFWFAILLNFIGRVTILLSFYFFKGFIFWNLDNLYCPFLLKMRNRFFYVKPIFEWHALWHLASFYCSLWLFHIGLCTLDDRFYIEWDFLGFPSLSSHFYPSSLHSFPLSSIKKDKTK